MGFDKEDGQALSANELEIIYNLTRESGEEETNTGTGTGTGGTEHKTNQVFSVDFALSAGTVSLTRGKRYCFKSFTLNGGTLDIIGSATGANAGKPVVIIVRDDVNITSGTINFKGKGHRQGNGALSATTAGGGNGGGIDVSAYATAKNTGGAGGDGDNAGGGSGGGGAGSADNQTAGAGGGTAGDHIAFIAGSEPDDLAHVLNIFCGAGGGGGGTGNAVADGGNGGAGGCSIIIVCLGDLTFSGGTIDVSGNDGSAGSGEGGPGGGGGGGDIVLMHKGTLTTGGTTDVTGGSGGVGGSNSPGGDGGDGTVRTISIA